MDKDTLKSLSTSVSLQAQPEIAQKAEIVETRDKAIEVLRVVLRFFQEHDRSNPVPTILNQALELSRLSFGEIWDRYAPEEVAAIRLQLGASRPEKGPST